MSLAAAIPVALVAAACYGMASALQAAEASRQHETDPHSSGLRALVRRPLWLVAAVADLVGLVLHVLALTLGPASLVQPLQVTGLLLALPLSRRLRTGRSASKIFSWRAYVDAELLAALLLVVGLGAFLAGTRPRSATISLGSSGIGGLLAAGLLAQLAATYGTRRCHGRRRSAILGAAAGASFAVTSVLVDSLARERRIHGWAVLLEVHAVVLIVGAVGLGVGGLLLSQRAFQSGPLGQSLPTITVIDPLIAVVLGGALLGETPRLGRFGVLLDLFALVTVTAAVRALSRTPEPAAPVTRTHQRLATADLAGAAAVGSCYGLAVAVLITFLDVRADADDGPGLRLLLMLSCVAAAALVSVGGQVRRSREIR